MYKHLVSKLQTFVQSFLYEIWKNLSDLSFSEFYCTAFFVYLGSVNMIHTADQRVI